MSAKEQDILLGQIAVSCRMVTEAHLRDALRAQKNTGRPLGEILVKGNYLTPGQLDHIIRTQSERLVQVDEEGQADPRDGLFGRLAMLCGHVTQEELNQCVREQAGMARMKIFFRLGEILIKNDFMTTEQVKETLEMQKKRILECPECHRRYNIGTFEADQALVCSQCEVELVPPRSDDESVTVAETLRLDTTKYRSMKREILRKKREAEENLDNLDEES